MNGDQNYCILVLYIFITLQRGLRCQRFEIPCYSACIVELGTGKVRPAMKSQSGITSIAVLFI
jgi:hypothetical protein